MASLVGDNEEYLERLARKLDKTSKTVGADHTERVYKGRWAEFELWCADYDLPYLKRADEATTEAYEADFRTVALYLQSQAARSEISWSTVAGKKAALQKLFDIRVGQTDNPVRDVRLKGYMKVWRRELGKPPEKKRALVRDDIKLIISKMGHRDNWNATTVRDRAVILLAFATGMRRAEINTLNVEDLEFPDDGSMRVFIRKSKTDQFNEGVTLRVDRARHTLYCPVRAMQDWLDMLERWDVCSGAIVRRPAPNGDTYKDASIVARIFKYRAEQAGIEPDDIGGHSTRFGMITAAIEAGVDMSDVMGLSRHKDVNVFAGYIRKRDTAGAGIARKILE